MWYDQTGLIWVDPSPNLRSVNEATLYPGGGVIEGGNVSVGRGTASPFELVGEPWVNGPRLAGYLTGREISGVRFEPTTFTLDADRYAGRDCQGTRIIVTDRARLDVARLSVELVAAFHRLYPARLRLDATLSMIGSSRVLAAVAAGVDPRDVTALWRGELNAFEAVRARYPLYPN